jgi:hypothetical protein
MKFEFQINSNQSQKLDKANDGLPRSEKWSVKYGPVHNWIRNKFPHCSFSKFKTEFELKFR